MNGSVKRYLKNITLFILATLTAITIFGSPNPGGTMVFLAVLWLIGWFIARNFKTIHKFSASNVPLKDFLAEEAERKRIEATTPPPVKLDTRDITLDAEKLTPLTEHETVAWNEFINNWDNNQK